MPQLIVALGLLLFGAACAEPPIDPEGTLQRVTGGTIRAGITDNPPWTIVRDTMEGVEVALIEELAEELDAQVEWTEGSEEELYGALAVGQLDVVVGGFSAQSPYSQHAAFTYPYFTSRIVVVGKFDLEDIAGVPVAVEAHSEAAGLLAKTDAVVKLVDDVAQGHSYVAIEDWRYDPLAVRETGVVLKKTDHVMAVPLGENGWMVTLEKFLLERASDVPHLLDEAES